MIGMPLSGWIAVHIGWRGTMVAYGSASVMFGLVWQLLACAVPSECSYISKEEQSYITSAVQTASTQAPSKLSVREVLSHASIWSLFIAHFAFNFVVYSILNWTPTFYKVCNIESIPIPNLSPNPNPFHKIYGTIYSSLLVSS